MTENKKPCIFISHASADKPIAEALSKLIEKAFADGIVCWFSSDDRAKGGLTPGSPWFNEIHEHLLTATRVFTLVTPNSIDRQWIYWESGIGTINCKGGTTPIVIGVSIDDLKPPLSHLEGCDGLNCDSLGSMLAKVGQEAGLKPPSGYLEAMCEGFVSKVHSSLKATASVEESILTDPALVTKDEFQQVISQFETKLDGLVGKLETPGTLEKQEAPVKPDPEIKEAGKQAVALNLAGAKLSVSAVRALVGRLYNTGDMDHALALQRYVTGAPNARPTDHSNLGILLHKCGRKDEAESAYRKAIEADPNQAGAWLNLGVLLREGDREDEAESAYRKAIEADPQEALAWCNLGNLLVATDREDEAESAYRRAIEADPKGSLAWCNLGNLLKVRNRKEEAENAYRKGIEADTEDADLRNQLAYLLWDLGRFDEAEAEIREALSLDSSNSYANATLGLLHFEKDDLIEGKAFYKCAIGLQPDYLPLQQKFHLEYARALARNGKKARAKTELEKAKETNAGYVTSAFIDSLLTRLDHTSDWSIP